MVAGEFVLGCHLCLQPDLGGIGRAGHWGWAPGRDFSLGSLRMMFLPPNSSLEATRAT